MVDLVKTMTVYARGRPFLRALSHYPGMDALMIGFDGAIALESEEIQYLGTVMANRTSFLDSGLVSMGGHVA